MSNFSMVVTQMSSLQKRFQHLTGFLAVIEQNLDPSLQKKTLIQPYFSFREGLMLKF